VARLTHARAGCAARGDPRPDRQARPRGQQHAGRRAAHVAGGDGRTRVLAHRAAARRDGARVQAAAARRPRHRAPGRALPGRHDRPAGDWPLRRRGPGVAVAGRRGRAAARGDRLAAARTAGQAVVARRAGSAGDQHHAGQPGTARRARAPAAADRPPRRRKGPRPDDRAGGPVAAAVRARRRVGRADRPGRQRARAREQGHRVDPRQLRGTDAGPGTRPDGRAEPVGVPPPIPGRHRHEPAAVPEAHPAAGGTRAADRGDRRRGPGWARGSATPARPSSTASTEGCSAPRRGGTPNASGPLRDWPTRPAVRGRGRSAGCRRSRSARRG